MICNEELTVAAKIQYVFEGKFGGLGFQKPMKQSDTC